MKTKKIIVIVLLIVIIFFTFLITGYSQSVPGYGFIDFTKNYNVILQLLKKNKFEIKEEEITTKFGNFLILASQKLNYYTQNLYLFFNEKKELIYMQIVFSLNDLQTRIELEKLFKSIQDKLISKYGESENETYPYYKIYENEYEITLLPLFPGANKIKVTYKYIEKYKTFIDYYKATIEKEVDNEVNNILNNF